MGPSVSRAEIVDWATALYEDLDFGAARRWCAEGGSAAGYLPVYVPKEVIWAAGMLPVGIHGAGEHLEVIRGDAYYQSYICHLPRSVVELALTGRLDMLSAVLFPSTCDVIRNLSGMWNVLKPGVYVRYVDLPQVRDPEVAGPFWRHELHTLFHDLCEVAGRTPEAGALRDAIARYNEAREVVRELYRARREAPWRVPSEELYLLLRAGELVPVDTWIDRARAYLAATEEGDARRQDKVRVMVVGAFCEQPPLGLIKTVERAGCYIVDDDFLLGNRLIDGVVPLDGDPFENLSLAFLRHAMKSSILFEGEPGGKKTLMAERARAAGADGIIFAAPSFCDPALLDRPMLRTGAEAAGLPCIAFKYSENTGQFQPYREQAGTFSDSIKLWGGE